MNDAPNRDEALRPVVPVRPPVAAAPPTGDFYSKIVMRLAWAVVLGALVCSAVAFAGFAENDQGFLHLMSAFGLCFGVGALVYVPFGLIANYAKNAVQTPLPRYRAVFVLFLLLPWFPLGFYLFRLGGKISIFAIFSVILACFIGLWAARYLRSARR